MCLGTHFELLWCFPNVFAFDPTLIVERAQLSKEDSEKDDFSLGVASSTLFQEKMRWKV